MTTHSIARRRTVPESTRNAIWLTLLTIFLSWAGGLSVELAYGEKPAAYETGWSLKDVTRGSLLFRTNEAGRYIPAPMLKTDVKFRHRHHRPNDVEAGVRQSEPREGQLGRRYLCVSTAGDRRSRSSTNEGWRPNNCGRNQGAGRGQENL